MPKGGGVEHVEVGPGGQQGIEDAAVAVRVGEQHDRGAVGVAARGERGLAAEEALHRPHVAGSDGVDQLGHTAHDGASPSRSGAAAEGPVSLPRVDGPDDEDELGPAAFARDLVRWSETLAGIARTGLGFTQSLYERERYEEVLHVAADIKAAADEALEIRRETDHFIQEWMESVGEGVPGYVTPKVAIGAVVGNERGEILLVKRAESGVWLYPTGWADVGYSPAEVAVKEVAEETGVDVEVLGLFAVFDGLQLGLRIPLYSLVWHCR